ncbi:MAG TPA: 3-hydroxyacyl-CoA dehydrogenase [Chloroflexota bacterium]|nr:3-hydroxyacyl-CoA dehydrogenase [Chloroflexota bacterium]HUM70308.1 3-hydroxyacyl-CoA dehydrogenase [Chloroflexota bacterium]
MQVQNHTFLVTGGSSGLGAACVRRLAAAGGQVIIADLNETAGAELAAELGQRVRFVRVNVSSAADVETAVNTAITTFGALHGVINCAGIAIAAKLLDREGNPHDFDAFNKVIQVNLVGTFNVIRLAAAVMSKNEANAAGERGVIINTASVAAYDGQIGQVAYAASKGGVVALTLPIARELARFGIRVMTIAPGIFETPMMAGLPEKARQSLAEQVPFPSRLGRPDEYAALAQHIIENEMLNGEVIRLDGAIRMAPK